MSSSSRGVGCHQLQQSRYAAIFLAFLVLSVASSCSERPIGEFTADECSDDEDNDRDSLTDCADPDCWVFCPFRGAFQVGDASSSPGTDGAPDPVKPPAADSGKPIGMPEDDAGTAPVDAATDDDAGSSPGCECASDETCIDGECKLMASISGTYTLSVRSALVPLGPSSDRCFDYENVGCLARSPIVCDCVNPDTYVVVLLNGTPLMKATTTPVRDTANPVWTDAPKVTINLKATDKLTFLAFDSDGIGQDPQIFSCVPLLADLATGTDTLACNPKPGPTVPTGNYIITVILKKLVPDASVP